MSFETDLCKSINLWILNPRDEIERNVNKHNRRDVTDVVNDPLDLFVEKLVVQYSHESLIARAYPENLKFQCNFRLKSRFHGEDFCNGPVPRPKYF